MPEINYSRVANLPALVRSFCHSNEGWVVGGGASYLLSISENIPRDWDVLVPFWQWGLACKTIPEGSLTNSHGGVKLVSGDLKIDVWAGDIGWFLAQVPSYPSYAVHPKSMTFLAASKQVMRVKS